jgi:hypothetical protein
MQKDRKKVFWPLLRFSSGEYSRPLSFVIIFGILVLFRYHKDLRYFLHPRAMMDIMVPGLLFIPTFFYFLSGKSSVVAGFIWQFKPLNEIAFHYFFGVVVDLLVLYGIVLLLNLHKSSFSGFIHALFALLIMISLVRMGKWNDWFLRGSTPVLTLLSLFILHGFQSGSKSGQTGIR